MDSLALALAFYRQPFAHPDLLNPANPLPQGIDQLLMLAVDARVPERAELSDAEESRLAARFFVQQVFFVKGASHYRVLGLNLDANQAEIKLHHRLLMRLFHPDRQRFNDAWADSYAQRINEAYTVLRRDEQRQRYDRSLQAARNQRLEVTLGSVNSPMNIPTHDGLRTVGIRVPRSMHLPAWVLRRLPETVLGVVALIALLSVVGVYLSQHQPMGLSSLPVVDASATAPGDATASALHQPDGLPDSVHSAIPTVSPRVVMIQTAVPATPMTPATPAIPGALLARLAPHLVPVPARHPDRPSHAAIETLPAQQVMPPPPVPRERPSPPSDLAAVALAAPSQPEPMLDETAADRQAPPMSVAVVQSGASDEILSRLDLEVLISLFVGAYERGDIDAMMALFADRVDTGDQMGKGGIRSDYQKLFNTTRNRELNLSGLRWVRRGGSAKGHGVFEARLEGAERVKHFAGTLRLEVTKQQSRVMITGFFHRDLPHDAE